MSVEQTAQQLSDDLDLIDAVMEEHIEEDMAAHRAATEAFQEWKLNSLRSQNRMMFAVILALVAALSGVIVPLLTK